MTSGNASPPLRPDLDDVLSLGQALFDVALEALAHPEEGTVEERQVLRAELEAASEELFRKLREVSIKSSELNGGGHANTG